MESDQKRKEQMISGKGRKSSVGEICEEENVEVYQRHEACVAADRRGLIPSRVVTIHDEDGMPCVSINAQHQCWRTHFQKVLNVRSKFEESWKRCD